MTTDESKANNSNSNYDNTGGLSQIGLFGLAVMGQNLALNIASKGFTISVCNRSPSKVDACVERAQKENLSNMLKGFKDLAEFVQSLQKPRSIIILVKAGKPVEMVIANLLKLLEPDDLIIDGGNEWYENTERRALEVATQGILYMGMGVSGGEDGARFGPSLMPGGPAKAYARVEQILVKTAAITKDGTVCCIHIGEGGAGNYVKMIHNGIEYGDMQLIAEAYDLLKNVAGLTNEELAQVFGAWNEAELDSFLIEITANIFKKKDDRGPNKNDFLVDKVLDKTGQKGTGLWTIKEAAQQGVAAPTISAALNARYLSSLKQEREVASKLYEAPEIACIAAENRQQFIDDVRQALYASKICSYAQGMNLIRRMGANKGWNLNLGKIAAIWKGGCIIRAQFLDRITAAYNNNPDLVSLLIDPDFAREIKQSEKSWRRIVSIAIMNGIAVPAFSGSLAYYDSYRRARLPANLTQSQRDYFGAHTYQRIDDVVGTDFVHSEWSKM
jgi:6-phosphogluconate dehydrogenase